MHVLPSGITFTKEIPESLYHRDSAQVCPFPVSWGKEKRGYEPVTDGILKKSNVTLPEEIALNELQDTTETKRLRTKMVQSQLADQGITDPRVLVAMEKVPRHWFCPLGTSPEDAYGDYPLPIGWGATISQPWIVADMLQQLQLTGSEFVLEVGTGSGYNAALLGQLARSVITVEIVPELAVQSREVLKRGGFTNVVVHQGDGSLGWSGASPYDAIIVTAGAPAVPEVLANQLSLGGRMVIPVGDRQSQQLHIIRKTTNGFSLTVHSRCRFVPLHGQEGWQ